MSQREIIPGQHYHLFNRGNRKEKIFFDNRDYARFLFLLLFCQSPETFQNIRRQITYFVKHQMFNIGSEKERKISEKRYVELVCFSLMPNHFHLLVKEKEEGGIVRYMQRIQNAYTKYVNTRYEISGHLFQGSYKSVRLKSNEQLIYLSAYIHNNPREIKRFAGKESEYTWSSLQDYVSGNRWGDLLLNEVVLNQFSGGIDYGSYIRKSGAKAFN